MPLGDRTGPEGKGPLTGRGLGSCTTGKEKPKKTKRSKNFLQRRRNVRPGRRVRRFSEKYYSNGMTEVPVFDD